MTKFTLMFLGCFAISPLAFGQSSGDATAGRILADKDQCILCHGPDGNGNGGIASFRLGYIPRISAQPEAYFIKSIKDYKSGKRANDDMQTMAEMLSEKDIRNLAAWYGSQTPKAKATYDYNPEYDRHR